MSAREQLAKLAVEGVQTKLLLKRGRKNSMDKNRFILFVIGHKAGKFILFSVRRTHSFFSQVKCDCVE